MAPRDGDGWIDCLCSHRHWGLHGAAGLLLVRDNTVLLQHRAPWVHNGDTWGIPGGARDSHESAVQAAIREAQEEIGIDAHLLTPIRTFNDDHGNWQYHTIIAAADAALVAHEMNDESQQIDWVPFDGVTHQNLHPSFAKSWPALHQILVELFV